MKLSEGYLQVFQCKLSLKADLMNEMVIAGALPLDVLLPADAMLLDKSFPILQGGSISAQWRSYTTYTCKLPGGPKVV